ncbi:hypothetical protein ACGFZL_15170 [Streptomyces sp. NPDC048182]|uniref:hypothetical protein n=1 Tax=Streptomyces sp. NPDC048182 TaxID=3365507 RepID=UPI003714D713
MRYATAFACAAALLALTGCSSHDSAREQEWRETYCGRLGSWQSTKADGSAGGKASGYLAVAAARRLDREGLDRHGSHILDDTAMAVDGDTEAEGRAVAYCTDAGFVTGLR